MTPRLVTYGSAGFWLLSALFPAGLVGCARSKLAGPAPLASSAPLAACEQESSPFARDACYGREAKKTAQPALCLHLLHADKQAECVVETGDGIAACQQASTIAPVPDCFRDVARRSQDAAACTFIKSLHARGACISAVASTGEKSALCASVPRPGAQDECWRNVAFHRKDPKLCDPIKNAYRRDNCRLDTAKLEDGYPGGCALIENLAVRDECWIQLAGEPSAAADVCEHVGARKNGCYMALARQQGPAFCERVGAGPGSSARRACYQDVFGNSRARAAIDMCASVVDIVLKQECTRARAEATSDVGLCEGIALPEVADDCFAALSASSPDACLRITDPGRSRQCASSRWSRSRDPRMCALLSPKTRRDCLEQLAKRH
jgi:hypothetical protein